MPAELSSTSAGCRHGWGAGRIRPSPRRETRARPSRSARQTATAKLTRAMLATKKAPVLVAQTSEGATTTAAQKHHRRIPPRIGKRVGIFLKCVFAACSVNERWDEPLSTALPCGLPIAPRLVDEFPANLDFAMRQPSCHENRKEILQASTHQVQHETRAGPRGLKQKHRPARPTAWREIKITIMKTKAASNSFAHRSSARPLLTVQHYINTQAKNSRNNRTNVPRNHRSSNRSQLSGK